jgi:hypothetical protein
VLRLGAALAAAALLAGCGGHAAPDDAAFHSAVSGDHPGTEVTFDGTLLSEPSHAAGHEHLVVTAATGERVEVDHNTSLAPWVPAHAGDKLVVRGQLYIDPGPRVGVHCTHGHTSRGCPVPGFVELAGSYYE